MSTAKQKSASDPSTSVWVTANAGTGKTRVLTDRVLRLMLSGTSPKKILCLTFTNAAAAEMAERINRELGDWVIAEDQVLKERISRFTDNPDDKTIARAKSLFTEVVDNPNNLKIQTIHSFCKSLLKRFPLEAKITPHFTVIDEQISYEMISESWIRLLSETPHPTPTASGGGEQVFHSIKTMAGAVHDSTLKKVMSEVIKNRDKLERLLGAYGLEGLIKKTYHTLGVKKSDTEESIVRESFVDREGLKYLCEALSEGTKKEKERSVIIGELYDLEEVTPPPTPPASGGGEKRESLDEYCLVFLKKDGDKRKVITKKIAEIFPKCEVIVEREQDRLIALTDKIKSLKTAILTESLIHVSEAVITLYQNLKASKAFLDYDDLILVAGRLLNRPEVAPWIMYKLDGGIDHILIDEAQDTSPEQWEIIYALCSEFFAGDSSREINRTLFVVGDEKQSIFSFHGADLAIFNDMRTGFENIIKNAEKGWKHISLDLSFRSTEAVLKTVDAVFSEKMEHKAHRLGHYGKVELWPLIEASKKEDIKPWTPPLKRIWIPDPKQILADTIADTIKKWIASGKQLSSVKRAVNAGDIMILVRKRDELVEYLVKAMERENVAVAGVDRMVLTDHIAIMDLIAIGSFLLLPEDDLTLASILKSPLINLTEDDLFELAYDRGETSLWERIKSNSKYKKTYNYLKDLMAKVDYLSPFDLFSYILEVLGGRKAFISRLGYEANDPLDEFINRTIIYSETYTPSMEGFLHWMKTGNSIVKRDFDSDGGKVRIMTIHGAKGLQAPIVFLPDTTQLPRTTGNLFFDDLLYWHGAAENRNNLCKKLHEKERNATEEEYRRLLYVALTRAEDELYVCGYKKTDKINDECWYSLVRNGMSRIADENDGVLSVVSGGHKISDESGSLITDNCLDTPPYPPRKRGGSRSGLCKGGGEEVDSASGGGDKLPEFATTIPQKEERQSIIAPSQSDASFTYERGELIHLLLEKLPKVNSEDRIKIGKSIPNITKEMLDEALAVINKFPEIFPYNSQGEVPIAGKIGTDIISGQIDRLVISDDAVLIIDYKTNHNPPEFTKDIPPAYIKQMEIYASLIERIYPNKKVSSAILWTANLNLMGLLRDKEFVFLSF